jgi:hypothetical protein
MTGDCRTLSYGLSYVTTLQASGDQIREAWGVTHEIPVITMSHNYNWVRARPLKIKMKMAVEGAWVVRGLGRLSQSMAFARSKSSRGCITLGELQGGSICSKSSAIPASDNAPCQACASDRQ